MSEENQIVESKIKADAWWKDTAVMAVVPFIGYFLAYRYEASYCYAFGLPETFVQVDLAKVLSFTASLLVLGWFAASWAESFFTLGEPPDPRLSPFRRFFFSILGRHLRPLIAIYFFSLWLLSWSSVRYLLIIFAIYFGADILLSILSRLIVGKRKSFLETWAESPINHILLSPYVALQSKIGKFSVFLFVGLILGTLLASQMGRNRAERQTVFLVPTNSPTCVVVIKDSDRLICIGVQSNSITKDVIFVPTSEGVKLERRTLGKLKMAED